MSVINVSQPWFDLIKQGSKKVEGRLNKGKFKDLRVGDIIHWEFKDNQVKTKITRISHYSSFYDMLMYEGLRNVLPSEGIDSLEKGVQVYRQYFSLEKEKEFGVLAIKLRLIED